MEKYFSIQNRQSILNSLIKSSYDVVIIGGGITGAGIALDATLRGMKVLLVEMQDFSQGTSSRSTKLIHGGLRYLKNLEFKIVAQTGQEREILYKIAPHIVEPISMFLPIYKDGEFGKFSLWVALSLYDFLAKVPLKYKKSIISKEKCLEFIPVLKKEDLKGAGLYTEYRTDDARLTIEILKTAAYAGAEIINYTEVTGFLYQKDKIKGVKITDKIHEKEYDVQASLVVNATGPWVDKVSFLDAESAQNLIHTKGIHLVFDNHKLPLKQALYFSTKDGRMVFAVPRENKVYVGTTDTFYDGDIRKPIVTKDDIQYLMESINMIFPDAQLSENDIIASWAGLRPLVKEEGKKPSEISRKEEIFVSESGLISIAGGKLTGYRLMAKEVTDFICKTGFSHDKNLKKCLTKHYKLSGSKSRNNVYFKDDEERLVQIGKGIGLSAESAKKIVQRYGCNAEIIFAYSAKEQNFELPLEVLLPLMYGIEYEMIISADDFLTRRTGYTFFDPTNAEKYKKNIESFIENYTKILLESKN